MPDQPATPKPPRVVVNPGDLFAAEVAPGRVKYLQCLGKDASQLQSHVVAAFARAYAAEASPDPAAVVAGEAAFYAHTYLHWGARAGHWRKVASRLPHSLPADLLFRDSEDYGNGVVPYSEKWWVWRVNGEKRFVGPLVGAYRSAEPGSVWPAEFILNRMRTGEYGAVYPGYLPDGSQTMI